MTWKQDTSRLALIDRPIEVLGRVIGVYSEVVFSTDEYKDASGRVIGIDHGAAHPIKMEFHEGRHKRIVNFKPAEFSALKPMEKS